jgi:predicted nucleotidyltransferase
MAKKKDGNTPEIIQLGYFGSFAKDNWGVGSDLDLIVIIQDSSIPFERRPLAWDFDTLPVPTDILIYTMKEWQDMRKKAVEIRRYDRKGSGLALSFQ